MYLVASVLWLVMSRSPAHLLWPDVIVYIFLLSLAGCVALQSPLSPWGGGIPGNDSGVFMYGGSRILHGDMPYRDFFDHKGPAIFFTNAAGLALTKNALGVWLMEVLHLFGSAVLFYHALKTLTGRTEAAAGATFLLIATASVLEGGNMTEEYALLPISIALWGYLRLLQRQKNVIAASVLVGAAGAWAALLRPNAIGTWLAGFIVYAVWQLFRGSLRPLLHHALGLMVGGIIVLVPTTIYLASGNALDEAWADVWTFNRSYAQHTGDAVWAGVQHGALLMNRLYAVWLWAVVGIGLCFSSTFRNIRRPAVFVWFGAALSLLLGCALNGQGYAHYSILLAPFAGAMLALFTYALRQRLNNFPLHDVLTVMLLLVLCRDTAKTFPDQWKEAKTVDKNVIATADWMRKASGQTRQSIVIGNRAALYLLSNTKAASRFFYQHPVWDVSPSIRSAFSADLLQAKPQIVVVYNQGGLPDAVTSLLQHAYTEIPSGTEGTQWFQRR